MYWLNYYTWTDDQENVAALRAVGLSFQEIARLRQLRRMYQVCPDQQDQPQCSPDRAHLLFIRWLITQGKLSEQLEDRCISTQEENEQQSASTLFLAEERGSKVVGQEAQGISWLRHKLQVLRTIITQHIE